MAGDDGTVLSGARSSVHEKVNGIFHSFGSNEHHSKNVGFEDENEALLRTPPIADLFAHATVMFADICGFTAWSRYVLTPLLSCWWVDLAPLFSFYVVSLPSTSGTRSFCFSSPHYAVYENRPR